MLAYQSGISHFEGVETQVFGISTDNVPSQKEFADKLKLTFPLLSDFSKRQVAAAYGVLFVDRGFAGIVVISADPTSSRTRDFVTGRFAQRSVRLTTCPSGTVFRIRRPPRARYFNCCPPGPIHTASAPESPDSGP